MKLDKSLHHTTYVRPGLPLLIGKSFLVIAAFVALYMTGLLDSMLPEDQLSWIWIDAMIGIFLMVGLFLVIPYQNLVDREVSLFRKLMAYLEQGDDAAFRAALSADSYDTADSKTQLYRLLNGVRQVMSDPSRKTKVDIDRLLFRMEEWHTLKARPIHWMKSNLLTYGIVGTYVGIRLATGDAEMMASGEAEAIFAFVVEMFKYLGLAILSTLVGLKLGTLFIGHVISRAESTIHFIVNDLSGAFHDSRFIDGWVNNSEVTLDVDPSETVEAVVQQPAHVGEEAVSAS